MTPEEVAKTYALPVELAERSLRALEEREVFLLAVSGRIGAGKDSVAPRMMEQLGYPNGKHYSFAGPLREEVAEAIGIIKSAVSRDEAVKLVASLMRASRVEEVVDALYEDVKADRVTSPYQRTPTVRRALQWWGTEVRRAEDEDYWVKKAIRGALEEIASGTSVYVTDARFPNEANAVQAVQGFLVRLYVSPEEQERRITERDGEPPTREAIEHVSETALDDYNFKNFINTDTLTLDEVVTSATEMARK